MAEDRLHFPHFLAMASWVFAQMWKQVAIILAIDQSVSIVRLRTQAMEFSLVLVAIIRVSFCLW
jgi:hypothetical protein